MLTPPGNRRMRTARPTSLFALEAQKHLAAGRPKQAVEVCKIGLVYYPEHVTGYVVLAKAFLALDKGAQAANVLRDGYRRTGVEQLEALRAEISGESPTRERGRSIDRGTHASPRNDRPLSPIPASTPVIDLPAHLAPLPDSAAMVEPAEPITETTPELQQTDPLDTAEEHPAEEYPIEEPPSDPIDLPSPVEEPAPIEEPTIGEPAIEEPPADDPLVPEAPVEEPPVPENPIEEPPASLDQSLEATVDSEAPAVETASPDLPDGVLPAVESATEHGVQQSTMEESFPETEPGVEVPASLERAENASDLQISEESSVEAELETVEVEHPAVDESESESESVAVDPEPHTIEAEPESTSVAEPEADEVDTLDIPEPTIEVADAVVSVQENTAAEELTVEEEAEAEHQLDELLALLEMSTEKEPTGEQAHGSQEVRDALDETLPTFEATEKIPELRATAPRPVAEGASAEREAAPERGRSLSLAIHSRMNVTRLRSSNLRLIPGLEFAPLRHEDQQRSRQSIAPLIDETLAQLDLPDRLSRTGDAPPLPSFGPYAAPAFEQIEAEEEIEPLDIAPIASGTFSLESPPPIPRSFHTRPELREGEALTPLEELARRLEKARIPVVEEAEPRHAFEPSIVSDTFASILVAQGAYAEALKAYQTLARTKPERYEYYQQQIQDMQERMQNEEDEDEEGDSVDGE